MKTRPNDQNVQAFLNKVESEPQKQDSYALLEMMQEISGEPPKMWGDSIIGFGSYHYQYASGREGDWFLAGFSPRKKSISLYIMSGFSEFDQLLEELGKHKKGKSCLYINKLADVNETVLHELIRRSVEAVEKGKIRY